MLTHEEHTQSNDNKVSSKNNAKKNHKLGHRQRLKEKLLLNHNTLPDYEILELLLSYAIPRKDTKELAKEMLDRFGGIRGCMMAKNEELETVPGIAGGVSGYFLLLREFYARYMEGSIKEKQVFRTIDEFMQLAYLKLSVLSEEEVWLACVNNQNQITSFESLFKGGIDHVALQCRTIIEKAVNRKANGIFLCHNHPSGNEMPSKNDKELTANLSSVCENLGINFYEHFIITEKGCTWILAEKFYNV